MTTPHPYSFARAPSTAGAIMITAFVLMMAQIAAALAVALWALR